MFAFLWPYLAKAGFSLLITALEKSGVLNPLEASAARAEHSFVGTIQHLKTYQEYPTGKNGS
jgi:hypothetical protein